MKKLMMMMVLVLTIGAQAQDDGLDDIMASMMATKVHQDSIDTSRLVAVYDYECRTLDADGKAVTDRMKLCVQVGLHCTRSFPYRKYRMERQWAVWKLTGENLLDIRQYTRTSFMDTDRFVHTTNLVGRTIMLTCKLLLAGKK